MKLSVRPKTQPEVNLTSLIDVVLLLLIFFMVSTSFVKQSQIDVATARGRQPGHRRGDTGADRHHDYGGGHVFRQWQGADQ